MRIKLDENLPEALLPSLSRLGHEVDNVRIEQMAGRSDANVWQAAQAGGRLFITQSSPDGTNRKLGVVLRSG